MEHHNYASQNNVDVENTYIINLMNIIVLMLNNRIALTLRLTIEIHKRNYYTYPLRPLLIMHPPG